MDKFKVKTINRETIEVEGKLVKSTKPPKPPIWFQHFAKKQDQFNKEQKEFNKEVIQRFDKQEEFNKEQQKFNKEVIQRFDKIDNRIDNLVFKNSLKE